MKLNGVLLITLSFFLYSCGNIIVDENTRANMGLSNTSSKSEKSADLEITPDPANVLESTTTITILKENVRNINPDNLSIFYTKDGTSPTCSEEKSLLYSNPFTISTNTRIKSIVCFEDKPISTVKENNYRFKSWQVVGGSALSLAEGRITQIAVHQETPYVLFIDRAAGLGNPPQTSVKKFDGTNWVYVGAPLDFFGYALDLATTSNGTLYFAYISSWPYNIKVMKFNGVNWTNVGNTNVSFPTLSSIDLEIAPNNTPYIAYAKNQKVAVMKFNGTNWTNVGNAGISAKMYTPALIIDTNNVPYVAYGDENNGTNIMKFNGTNWNNIANTNFSGTTDYDQFLINDSNNNLYVSYRNVNNISVIKFDGTNVESIGNPNFTSVNGYADYNSSLVVYDDIIYIAYSDKTNSGKLNVMKFNGNSWEQVGSPALSTGRVDSVNMTVSDTGILYVVYSDVDNGSKATVIKYSE